MPRIDNERFYRSAMEIHGISAKGLNWHSKEYQEIRFDVILEMLPKSFKEFSVADAGCGFGDFYLYAKAHKKELDHYLGIECIEKIAQIASKKTKSKIIVANIIKGNLPKTSYYICSGAMNILSNFETRLFIRNCYSASEYGFIFNILHGDTESEIFNYLSTIQIRIIADELGVKNLVLRDDYLPNDITVGFFK